MVRSRNCRWLETPDGWHSSVDVSEDETPSERSVASSGLVTDEADIEIREVTRS
jgi:hypothetical protein